MMLHPTLHIRLTPCRSTPRVGRSTQNEHRGGPDTLLAWLETQLGLCRVAAPKASRITEYAGALEAVPAAIYSRSLATDRWATATELLARRDELRLAGWEREDGASLPALVRDIAKVEASRTSVFPDEAKRLRDVLQALSDGQRLPKHQCILSSPVTSWPSLWQQVLSHLNRAITAYIRREHNSQSLPPLADALANDSPDYVRVGNGELGPWKLDRYDNGWCKSRATGLNPSASQRQPINTELPEHHSSFEVAFGRIVEGAPGLSSENPRPPLSVPPAESSLAVDARRKTRLRTS